MKKLNNITRGASAGFTIVELLIVIVVIAIIAAISMVAYNGIQKEAYESKMKATYNQIEQALALHKAENDVWPICPGDTAEALISTCQIQKMKGQLDSVSDLPNTGFASHETWVSSYLVSNQQGIWGVQFKAHDGTRCKMGHNLPIGYWGSNIPFCWQK